MSDLDQHPSTREQTDPNLRDSAASWRTEANPDQGYGNGEPAQEPPPANGETDQPWDLPPAKAGLDLGDGAPANEPPPANGETDQPGQPPTPDVAETNGR